MSASSANPSMVRTSAPSQAAANAMHERAGIPSMSTVQAPHTPCSQPRWVPVRWRRSRRKSARWVRGSTSASTGRPFTVSRTRGRAESDGIGAGSGSGFGFGAGFGSGPRSRFATPPSRLSPLPRPARSPAGALAGRAGLGRPPAASGPRTARAARARAAAWSGPPLPDGRRAARSARASATSPEKGVALSTTSGTRSIAPTTARRSSRSGSSNTTARACANSPLFAASLQ